jgi:hypothetical protein
MEAENTLLTDQWVIEEKKRTLKGSWKMKT